MKAFLISDFNIETFAGYLSNDLDSPELEVEVAPFGQVLPTLMNAPAWGSGKDVALVWTQPQAVIPSFAKLLQYESVEMETLLGEVRAFAEAIRHASAHVKTLLVPQWTLSVPHRGFGLLDLKPGMGISSALMRMNLLLAEALSDRPGVFVLHSQRWLQTAGKGAWNAKLWYMSKNPFGNDVYKEAIKDVKAALRALKGQARKLLIVDLDDTLWGGIVGDVGWQNLRLGGHDPVGESFVDFQKALKSIARRGIVLGIVSKNTESVAFEAIAQHPEMVLVQEDFAGWRINWSDKAQNIADLAQELNLGLQSVVFIDDNPVERARVRDMLPEVLVPEWPEDKTQYVNALMQLSCFDNPVITEEDRARTRMYATEKQRERARMSVGSVEEWLATLEMQVQVDALDGANLARTAQLFNKTNQMNLSTRRMTETELLEWSQKSGRGIFTVRVSDKFGDAGLTGIVSVEVIGENAQIVDFILSCRVMGRKVEETMLHVAAHFAQNQKAKRLDVRYLETPKNQPCLEFLTARSQLSPGPGKGEFYWDLTANYPLPQSIQCAFSKR